MNKVEVTTSTGFTCVIDKDAMDDWYFAKAASKASKGGAEALEAVIYMAENMMPAKDFKRLEKHVKTEDGRVPASRIMSEVIELFNGAGEKN